VEWRSSEKALHHLVTRVIASNTDLDFICLSVFSTDSTRVNMFGVVICPLELYATKRALGFCLEEEFYFSRR